MTGCAHEYELISGRFRHPVIRCSKCGRKYDLNDRFRLKTGMVSIPILIPAILLDSMFLRENRLLGLAVDGATIFLAITLTNWLTGRIYGPKLLSDPETYGDRMSSDL